MSKDLTQSLKDKTAIRMEYSHEHIPRKLPSYVIADDIAVCFPASSAALMGFFITRSATFFRFVQLVYFLGHSAVQSRFQFWPVAKMKKHLEPNKERSQENGLHKVIKKRWSSAFESAMAYKLGNPA